MAVGGSDPQILQDFLSARLSVSRRAAKAMVDARSVWVNGRCVWMARHRLSKGDSVFVQKQAVAAVAKHQDAPSRPQRDEARHIRILWREGDYLVCDKPAGILSCDAEGSVESILRLQEKAPSLVAVHRLDRDTTGCLLFAMNRRAFEDAVAVFKTHRVLKTYRAIAVGRFKFAHQTIDAPLDGKRALSRVARETSGDDACLLRVTIETGRTNQIRRHLASVGHPIAGDRVFGIKSARDPRLMEVPRQMLHASTLEMPDPAHPKRVIKAHSPLPADFRAALKLFGMGRA